MSWRSTGGIITEGGRHGRSQKKKAAARWHVCPINPDEHFRGDSTATDNDPPCAAPPLPNLATPRRRCGVRGLGTRLRSSESSKLHRTISPNLTIPSKPPAMLRWDLEWAGKPPEIGIRGNDPDCAIDESGAQVHLVDFRQVQDISRYLLQRYLHISSGNKRI